MIVALNFTLKGSKRIVKFKLARGNVLVVEIASSLSVRELI